MTVPAKTRVRRALCQLLDHAFDCLPFLLFAALVGAHGQWWTISV